jgi:hypothetical protein
MEDEKPSPFTDLVTGAAWFALAAFIVICAWQMDRLKHLQATIYTIPGLVPGLLGAAIGLTSVILMLRAVRAGALAEARWPHVDFREHWRLIAVLVLCLGYAIGLVGHGPPFWLGSAIFIAIFIFVFQFAERRRARTVPRGVLVAVLVGVVAGLAIHYVFQDLFLVRLP